MHAETSDFTSEPIPVGIVGAGTWASRVHIPAILEHPRFRLAGIWTRRPEQSKELADAHGVPTFDSFESLLDATAVVDFVVPPSVQPDIAVTAAARGKHLILEKPVGLDTAPLRRLQDMVEARQVNVEVFVTRFFDDERVRLLESLSTQPWTRAHLEWRSGAFRAGNPFATTWRAHDGPLWDIGPHALSQLEVILGPIMRGRTISRGDASVVLELWHASGATSTVDIDLASDVSVLGEALTLWDDDDAQEVPPTSVEPRPAFGRLLDYLAADLERDPHEEPVSPRQASLTDGIRMVELIQAVSKSARERD